MRSYGLGIAFGMVVAAIYAFQNTADIVVRFIVWERVLPQGVWEVSLFAAGAVAMWFISLSAILEIKGKNSRLLKEQKKTIETKDEELNDVREERKSLLIALRKSGVNLAKDPDDTGLPAWKQDVECYTCKDEELLGEPEEAEVKEETIQDSSIEAEENNRLFSEDEPPTGDKYNPESESDWTGDNSRL